jgi:hypothetical protein
MTPIASLNVPHFKQQQGGSCTVSLNDPSFDSAPQKASLAGFLQAWAANAFLAAFIRPRP